MSTQQPASAKSKIERNRKPNARATEIVLGAIDERLSVLESVQAVESVGIHSNRLRELMDELRRSLKRQPAETEAE